jgi:hypothetical protein
MAYERFGVVAHERQATVILYKGQCENKTDAPF